MTKAEMVHQMAAKTGVEQEKVKHVVQLVLDGIIDVLADEGRIELRNFGIFEVRQRKARKARNPKTGAQVMAPSRKSVKFQAGKIMEARIAGSAATPLPPSPSEGGNGHRADWAEAQVPVNYKKGYAAGLTSLKAFIRRSLENDAVDEVIKLGKQRRPENYTLPGFEDGVRDALHGRASKY